MTSAPPSDREQEPRKPRRRPAFALTYPRHAALDELIDAFEAGEFAYVREQAPRLAAADVEAPVRDAARDLRRRIDPEPTAVYVWALGLALVLFLYLFYVSH
ncbi:MAG: hypothetical protein AAGN82_03140 [Myxococcota bacterium]